MAVNKVEYNGETLVDLTGDTVNETSLLMGATAHNAAGEAINGGVSVPTKTSELENDSNFATQEYVDSHVPEVEVPTKTSQLENDSGFLTSHQDISGKVNTTDIIDIAHGGTGTNTLAGLHSVLAPSNGALSWVTGYGSGGWGDGKHRTIAEFKNDLGISSSTVYTGTTVPSSSLGTNGDTYLKLL